MSATAIETEELAVLGQIHDGAASGLERVHTIDGHGRNLDGLPRHQPHAAARDGVPVDARHDALPGDHVEPLGGGDRQAPDLRLRQHRGGDRVLGVPLNGRRAGEHLGLPQAIEAQHVRHPWRPEGHGPGLVHDDGVYPGQGLEPSPAFDDEASLGRSPDAGEHDGRRGHRDRARAGDQDDRHRGGGRPTQKIGQERGPHDHGDVVAGEAVGEALHRRLVGLGLLDEPKDSPERRLRPDPFGLDSKHASLEDRRGEDVLADVLLDRHGFPGNRRLVDGTATLGDPAIHRDALPRLDEDALARAHRLGRNLDVAAVLLDAGAFRGRGAGAPGSPGGTARS